MKNIAIVVVAYNRVTSLNRLLNSLLQADVEDAPLIISIDKSNTDTVERFANNFIWPFGEKKVITHDKNLGLRTHILSVGDWLDMYDAIIVLEDDIVVTPGFYRYAVSAYSYYHKDKNIAGISLYNYQFNYQTFEPFEALKTEYDVYFMQIAMSWGQVWMRDSWKQFYERYKKNCHIQLENIVDIYCFKDWGEKSWLKYHIAYCIEQNKYFVYPYFSYSTNCADKGTHIASNLSVFHTSLKWGGSKYGYKFPIFPNGVVYDSYNENVSLYKILNMSSENLVLDLCDNTKRFDGRRYLLTVKKMNFHIIKKFALEFRPIELNIIMNNWGEGIYLYDLSLPEKMNKESVTLQTVLYRYRIHSILAILHKIGFKSLLASFLHKLHRCF
jgi:glycosyltransferase involved in cell wall biosynthesis